MNGRACSICASPRCGEVDAALASGGRLVATGLAFGFSKSSVARHRVNCLAPRLSAAAHIVAPANRVRGETDRAKAIADGTLQATADDIATLVGLSARVARALDRLEDAADGAAAGAAYSALAALSGQVFRGVETAGRLHGLYGDGKARGEEAQTFTVNIVLPPLPPLPPPGTRAHPLDRDEVVDGGELVPTLLFDFSDHQRGGAVLDLTSKPDREGEHARHGEKI